MKTSKRSRRSVLASGAHAGAAVAAAAASAAVVKAAEEAAPPQKFLPMGLCGSENPTRANFPARAAPDLPG